MGPKLTSILFRFLLLFLWHAVEDSCGGKDSGRLILNAFVTSNLGVPEIVSHQEVCKSRFGQAFLEHNV